MQECSALQPLGQPSLSGARPSPSPGHAQTLRPGNSHFVNVQGVNSNHCERTTGAWSRATGSSEQDVPLLTTSFEDVPLFISISWIPTTRPTPQYTCATAVHHSPPVPPPKVTSKSRTASVGNDMRCARCHHVRNPVSEKMTRCKQSTKQQDKRRGAHACLSPCT